MSERSMFFVRMGIIGFIMGVVIGNAITFGFCMIYGQPSLVAQELADEFGVPLAVILQSLISGAVGALMMAGTYVYHSDSISLLAATIMHMALAVVTILPAGHFLWWTGRTTEGTLFLLLMMAIMYAMIWISMWASYRSQIRKINEMLESRRSEK